MFTFYNKSVASFYYFFGIKLLFNSLKIYNLFMLAFKWVLQWYKYPWVNSIMSGRNPTLYCTLTLLIAIPGHQTQQKQKTVQYTMKKVVIIHDNNAIEPYTQQNVGDKPTVILCISPVKIPPVSPRKKQKKSCWFESMYDCRPPRRHKPLLYQVLADEVFSSVTSMKRNANPMVLKVLVSISLEELG